MKPEDTPSTQSHLDVEERIRRRAHEIWLKRRDEDRAGGDLDDWLEAERQVLGGATEAETQSRRTTVGWAGLANVNNGE